MDQASAEDLVYKALSRTEWKTAAQVQREIGLDEITLAQIYVATDVGEIEGWIESRSEAGRRQYRLKGGGLRKTKKKHSWLGWLLPKMKEA